MRKSKIRRRRDAHQPRRLPQIPPQSDVRVGAYNVYICPRYHHTVTIDRDAGVTPSGMPCPREEKRGFPATTVVCELRATSAWYRMPNPVPPPDVDGGDYWASRVTHEWYRPDEAERRQLSPWAADHVNRGGLLLRRITNQPEGAAGDGGLR